MASEKLQTKYQLDIVHDVLLGKSNRIICYAEIADPKNVFLSVIAGTFKTIGLVDKPEMTLNELLTYYDPNNKYAEVGSVEKHWAYIYDNLHRFKDKASATLPIINQGDRRWITVDLLPIEKREDIIVYFITDVTEVMNAQELNYEKSHKDSLTGLFNRYTLDYHYGERFLWPNFHVLYLDIDDFKPINDKHGHHIGNEYLIAFAQILKKYESGYNYFYRLGGDEFVGLFWEEEDKVKEIAESIIEDTNRLLFYPDERGITVSIGIMRATKRHDVIRKADEVLYEVKNKGKNHFVYVVEN